MQEPLPSIPDASRDYNTASPGEKEQPGDDTTPHRHNLAASTTLGRRNMVDRSSSYPQCNLTILQPGLRCWTPFRVLLQDAGKLPLDLLLYSVYQQYTVRKLLRKDDRPCKGLLLTAVRNMQAQTGTGLQCIVDLRNLIINDPIQLEKWRETDLSNTLMQPVSGSVKNWKPCNINSGYKHWAKEQTCYTHKDRKRKRE
ncbi:hypothetical protein Q9L58_010014 [Maublancomyces gigas]|uniref:Uncharacterized protein n=1 Tax=Discina gigas TaxID=1032678 RepID=A0ABR3G5C2_9PEZI